MNEKIPVVTTANQIGNPIPKLNAKTEPSRKPNGLMELNRKLSVCGAIR